MTKAYSSSMQRGDGRSVTHTRSGEVSRFVTEANALRTSSALELAVHIFSSSEAPAARAFSRRGVQATRPAATRRPNTDFRSVGRIEDELQPFAGESALSGLACSDADYQRTRGDMRASVRQPMQKSVFHIFLPSHAKSPNQSLQPTASRRTTQF
jgi:hypothetical protein